MALFSFWKRNSTTSASHDSFPPAARATSRARANAQGNERDSAIDAELPQKRSARRRLIGAVVLVLGASLILPIVFDSEPKASHGEAKILMPEEVPAEAPVKAPAKVPAKAPVKQAAGSTNRTDNESRGISPQQSLDRGEELLTEKVVPRPPAKAAEKPVDKFQQKMAENAAEKAAEKNAEKRAEKGRLIVQIGAFPAEANAQNWQAKLKAVKVPTFVEKQLWQGGERYLLRAGPFATQEQAEAAIATIEQTGLNGRLAP